MLRHPGRPRLRPGRRRRGRATRSAIAAMCSGVVPQQPPTMRDAVALDELAEHLRDLLGGLREDRLAVGALDRQPGVGDAVHRQRRRLAEVADRIAHVLGPGRAVEADDVDPHPLERSPAPPRCRCRAASCRRSAAATPRPGSARVRPTRVKASRAPTIAARTSRMSCAVSMISRSAPPSTSAPACSSKTSASSAKLMSPRVGSSLAGRKPGRADRAGDEALRPGGLAGDLGRPAVDLDRVARRGPTRRASAASPGRSRSRRPRRRRPASPRGPPAITSGRCRTSASWHLPRSPP